MTNIPGYSLYSTKHQTNLIGLMFFELKSFLGRLLLGMTPPLVNPKIKLLHLGCGNLIFAEWVNADFFVFRFWRKPKSLWMLDLRYPLKCEDNYWDGIFTQHVLEHLYPNSAFNLLEELLRTLKSKHWVRICVPDLSKYVAYYIGEPSHKKFYRWTTGAEAIWALTQNWGHRSVWDSQLLTLALRQVGFVNVREVGFGQGTDERLIKDSEERKCESLYVEAQKP